MSKSAREPAVAGMFYPSDTNNLRCLIEEYLRGAECSGPSPKAIIVPHAGMIYSGPIAASAYAKFLGQNIKRVVLLGPSHRIYLDGLAAPGKPFWRTPLGSVSIDQQALSVLKGFDQVIVSDLAHEAEHSLEVQLPFLQTVFDDFKLLPLVVGDVKKEEVAKVLGALWGGTETLLVVSSDLSHYEPYGVAVQKDRATSEAILSLCPDKICPDDACGHIPIAGLLHIAKQKNMKVELLDLRSSGDTAGDKTQVVGYGAFAFYL